MRLPCSFFYLQTSRQTPSQSAARRNGCMASGGWFPSGVFEISNPVDTGEASSLRERPGDAEAVVEVTGAGVVAVVEGGAHATRVVEPRSAAHHVPVASNVTVFNPLACIAIHVVQAKSIRPEAADRRRLFSVPLAAAAIAVSVAAANGITPWVGRSRPCPCRIFPF